MNPGRRTALIGDIGGTHARFAISDVDEMSIAHFAVFEMSMFSSLQDAIRHYLESIPQRPAIAGFSLAAPVDGDEIAMTYVPWRFTRGEIAEACGAEHVHFVNDIEALALSLPWLNEHDLVKLGGGEPDDEAPKVVLACGSGFGIAGLVRHRDIWIPVSGPAGLAAIGATSERELAIMQAAADESGYVPIWAILSGRGMRTIHRALAGLAGRPSQEMSATDIVHAAVKEEDVFAIETIECFADLLARTAGDTALRFGARGGVYLAGGIPQKILPFLKSDAFRAAFGNKGKASNYLASTPLHAVVANDAGLKGAALAVSEAFPL